MHVNQSIQDQPVAEAGVTEMAMCVWERNSCGWFPAYEQVIHKGSSRTRGGRTFEARQTTNFSPQFFQARVTLAPNAEEGETRTCRIEELAPGMIIQENVLTSKERC